MVGWVCFGVRAEGAADEGDLGFEEGFVGEAVVEFLEGFVAGLGG